jgi:hypothetical protein
MRWPWLVLFAACHPGLTPPADSEAVLRRQTQELMDAVTNGDAKVWDRYLDPDVVYVSEAGDIETKTSLVPQIVPLPKGISGSIKTIEYVIKLHDTTAVVKHLDDEHEDFFGHAIHAQYLTTATWHFTADGWKLIGAQVLATLLDPPAVTLPPAQLDEYVGSYKLSDTMTYVITRDGDGLVGQRTGGKRQVLKVEVRDMLFVVGQPRSRKIFMRDAAGKITQMIDRREGRDIVSPRV